MSNSASYQSPATLASYQSPATLASKLLNNIEGCKFYGYENGNTTMSVYRNEEIGKAIVLFGTKQKPYGGDDDDDDGDDDGNIHFDQSKLIVISFIPTGGNLIPVNTPSGGIYNEESINNLIKVLRSNYPESSTDITTDIATGTTY